MHSNLWKSSPNRSVKYCKFGNFREILIVANFVKRHIRFTNINNRQSDFAIPRRFHFHETSHMRSFAKIKSSRKFPFLQYIISVMGKYDMF